MPPVADTDSAPNSAPRPTNEPQGIRVNLVCPGVIDTPMHQRIRGVAGDEVFDQGVLSQVHLRRAGQSEEAAQAVAFLCSDAASYLTGPR